MQLKRVDSNLKMIFPLSRHKHHQIWDGSYFSLGESCSKQPGEELILLDVPAALEGKGHKRTAKRRWKRVSKSNEVSAQKEGKNQSTIKCYKNWKRKKLLIAVEMMSNVVIPHKLWKKLELPRGNDTTKSWLKGCLWLMEISGKEFFQRIVSFW